MSWKKSVPILLLLFAFSWISGLVFGFLIMQWPDRYENAELWADPKIAVSPGTSSPGEELRIKVSASSGFVLERLEISTDDGRWRKVLLDENYNLPSCLDFRGGTCITVPASTVYRSVSLPRDMYSEPRLNLKVRAQGVKATIDEYLEAGPDAFTFLWQPRETVSHFRLKVDPTNRKRSRWIASLIGPSAIILALLASILVKGGVLGFLPREKRALIVLVPLVSGTLGGFALAMRHVGWDGLLGAYQSFEPLDVLIFVGLSLLVMAAVLIILIVIFRLMSLLLDRMKPVLFSRKKRELHAEKGRYGLPTTADP